jgi:hydrogenase maturation protease
MARVVVVGIGNVLSGDDGLGPFVARTLLAAWDFPGDVEVVDAGTPGGDLVSLLHGTEAVVLVDAVRDRGRPGEVRRYERPAILAGGVRTPMSPHEPGLREALLTLDFRGGGPSDVVLWGAIPADLELGTRLSPAVRAAVPAVVEGVLSELERLGARPRRPELPRDPDVWWEREGA